MDLSPKAIYHTTRQLGTLMGEERDCWDYTDLSLSERAGYWRRGFLSRADVLYDFETYDRRAYLTDYERYVGTRGINGRFGYALDNKLVFHRLLSDFDERLPELYGIVEEGTFRPIADRDEERGPARPITEWIEETTARARPAC